MALLETAPTPEPDVLDDAIGGAVLVLGEFDVRHAASFPSCALRAGRRPRPGDRGDPDVSCDHVAAATPGSVTRSVRCWCSAPPTGPPSSGSAPWGWALVADPRQRTTMRLELGRRADYGIRAMTDLARHYDAGQRRKAREIADEMAIPPTYVSQVLAELVRGGLAVSTAGRRGGYELARPPGTISLLAVIRAVDDEPGSTVCVLRGGPCRWEDRCAVHVPWFEAQQAMLQRLERATFAEIIELDAALVDGGGTVRTPVEGLDRPGPPSSA
jgi:Rrf2 family protein